MNTQIHKKSNGSSHVPSVSEVPSAAGTEDAVNDEVIVKALEHVKQAEQLLGVYLRPLKPGARRRVLRMRRGGEGFTLFMARLAASNPMLRLFPFDPARMETPIATMRKLTPLTARLRNLTQTLEDTLLNEKSNAWAKALEVYRMAQRIAEHDYDLAAELAPWEKFLKTGSRKPEKKNPTA